MHIDYWRAYDDFVMVVPTVASSINNTSGGRENGNNTRK